MEEVLDVVNSTMDKLEKAQFMLSDIQDEAFGGYTAPSAEDYKESAEVRGSVRLEMARDYLELLGVSLSRIYDMVSDKMTVAV